MLTCTSRVYYRAIFAHNVPGLAVSGGVDSMALATLCRDLSTARPALGLQFKALIVDHNVREESASEASEVATILQNMGKCHLRAYEAHSNASG